MRWTLPFVWTLSACGAPAPCPPRAQVTVTDHTDSTTGLVARIEAGLDAFYAQTGRDTLCLVEVEAVESISRQLLTANHGRYSVPRSGGLIELMPTTPLVDERVLRHELCHALDWTEGIQTTHETALLAELPDGIEGLYEEEQVLWEAYARVCQWGPRPPVDRWLEASCPGLTFGTPGERVDERVTWSSVFDEPVGGGLSLSWQGLDLAGDIQAVWRAGDVVVVLEATEQGQLLRWLDSLDEPMEGVPVSVDLDETWVWPGSDRALLVAGVADSAHRLVFRDGTQESVDLGEAYGWGPGAIVEERAAGVLVEPTSGVPLAHELEVHGEVISIVAPYTDSVSAGMGRLEWSSPSSWVLTHGENDWKQLHHGAVANGVDTNDGRLFRVDADAADGAQVQLLALLTNDGTLHTAGCDALEGLPARLGEVPVVVRADGSTLHVGVVSVASE